MKLKGYLSCIDGTKGIFVYVDDATPTTLKKQAIIGTKPFDRNCFRVSGFNAYTAELYKTYIVTVKLVRYEFTSNGRTVKGARLLLRDIE